MVMLSTFTTSTSNQAASSQSQASEAGQTALTTPALRAATQPALTTPASLAAVQLPPDQGVTAQSQSTAHATGQIPAASSTFFPIPENFCTKIINLEYSYVFC